MGYPNVMLPKMIVDVIKPIIWANRLGGPGTNFSLNGVLGTMILVTNNANGLNFGPKPTLAAKPYSNMTIGT